MLSIATEELDRLIERVRDNISHVAADFPDEPRDAILPLTPESVELLTGRSLARYIDYTLLRPKTTPFMLERACDEAMEWEFATVCVNPVYVERCARLLAESPVGITSVVGFPLGANTREQKVREAIEAAESGATELDMVMNLGYMKGGLLIEAYEEIVAIAQAVSVPLKVIIETGLLNTEEKIASCLLAWSAGAAFVKTSTGFNSGGATEEDVTLMRRVVGRSLGVKASGGLRYATQARAMLAAGATRLGASMAVEMICETDRQTPV